MEFGQLIEYDMRNILFEKSYSKCGGETIPRTFSKNWAYLWINGLKSYTIFMKSWGLSIYIETKLQTTCFYPI